MSDFDAPEGNVHDALFLFVSVGLEVYDNSAKTSDGER